jgi:transcription initiation factor TFIID subunit TAF12
MSMSKSLVHYFNITYALNAIVRAIKNEGVIMSHLFHDIFGGDSSSNALQQQLSQQQQQQQKLLKQQQAQQETVAQQVEKQRIESLRGRFGADTTSPTGDGSTGVPSQTTPQSSASLYAMLTGNQ